MIARILDAVIDLLATIAVVAFIVTLVVVLCWAEATFIAGPAACSNLF